MNRARNILSRLLTLGIAVAVIATVFGIMAPAGDPYLSALSDLAATQTLAQTSCSNTACETGANGVRRCKKNRPGLNCAGETGSCRTGICS